MNTPSPAGPGTDPGNRQREAAERLLTTTVDRHEDQIRLDVTRLFDSLDIDSVHSHRSGNGFIDIYLPRRRLIIETKAGNAAKDPNRPQPRERNETPLQQLERYIRNETETELGFLDLDDFRDHPRTGILTNGHVWHAYRYAHEHTAARQTLFTGLRPASPQELLDRLTPLLDGKPIGKPWIPAEPEQIFALHLQHLEDVRARLPHSAERSTTTKQQLWLVGWLIDRYRIRSDKRSGITNDPNGWFDDPRDLVKSIRRIVHVSVQTVRIIDELPGALDA